MKVRRHERKALPQFYEAAVLGLKRFEVREEDKARFEQGDVLVLREWDEERKRYTGRHIQFHITYVLRDFDGIVPGYAVLSLQ